MIQATKVAHRTVKARDLDIFYREAGPKDAPAVLLLHGFPTSSQMFRNLNPAPGRPLPRARSLPRLRSQLDAAAGRVRLHLRQPRRGRRGFTAMLGTRHSVRVSLSNNESRWQPCPENRLERASR